MIDVQAKAIILKDFSGPALEFLIQQDELTKIFPTYISDINNFRNHFAETIDVKLSYNFKLRTKICPYVHIYIREIVPCIELSSSCFSSNLYSISTMERYIVFTDVDNFKEFFIQDVLEYGK